MKSLVSLLFWAFFVGKITAQAPAGARPITLVESLGMALANSPQLKKAQLEREGFDLRLKEARSAVYPQIEGNVIYEYAPVLPTQLMPGELFGMSEGTYVPAQFGRPWQMTGALTVTQRIYDESMFRGIPAIDAGRSVSNLLVTRTEEDILFSTATVFYQTFQTEQLLRAVNANMEKFDALQRMAELQLANDYAIPTDVKRIRVARTNLETQRQKLLTGISVLHQTLQYLCGVPFEQSLQLTEDMTNPAADSLRWLSLKFEPDSITEHLLILRSLELNRIQTRSKWAERLPSLSAYATGLYQTWRDDANIFSSNGTWYGAAAFGLKLDVPIFDGFSRNRKVNVLELEAQKLEEDRRLLDGAKALEFRQAREELQNSIRLLQYQSDNVALAREITDKLLLQYKEGVVSLTDLLNAQTAMSEAETNYWQQVFSYKLAVLKLLKATGKLEELKKR
ncbi:MAG TPA: TolC family protein [Saprospiraceae bacterium]|nr:TolC family protein [Saprospiraceae bacterium]